MHVGMQGHMLPGWPQALHVQPCASKASLCWLSGSALQVCTLCDMHAATASTAPSCLDSELADAQSARRVA